jgi:hypothetical protein
VFVDCKIVEWNGKRKNTEGKKTERKKAGCGVIQREQEEETSYLVVMSGGHLPVPVGKSI